MLFIFIYKYKEPYLNRKYILQVCKPLNFKDCNL
jgi:hypothetical protein